MSYDPASFPKTVFSGSYPTGHCQGIAVDCEKRVIYYSFTTQLVKTDFEGHFLGSVTGLIGHLGCIAFNRADGRVYGSLEYKNDVIGRGILRGLGRDPDSIENAFYIAVFDGDKITSPGMDAERDGIMRAAFLKRVTDDYLGTAENGKPHVRGCSGIDGTAIGPTPGSADGKPYLFVAYGIYSDHDREDNDYQVLARYDLAELDRCARPLSQSAMHKSGAEMKEELYFVYTGNTDFGVQNLEYDPYQNVYYLAVYPGSKPQYPNFPMFTVDASIPAKVQALRGQRGAEGKVLSLTADGILHEASGVRGWRYPYGSTGFAALGGGYYYVSYEGRDAAGHNTTVRLCRRNGTDPIEPIE